MPQPGGVDVAIMDVNLARGTNGVETAAALRSAGTFHRCSSAETLMNARVLRRSSGILSDLWASHIQNVKFFHL
jgi:hypothetical protein